MKVTNPALAGFVVCRAWSVDAKAMALPDLLLCHLPARDGVVTIGRNGDPAVGVGRC
jgi:hypothetical protein